MDIDLDALRQTFLNDAPDYLSRMDEALLRAENNGSDHDALMEAFRAAHTLKGDASCVGYGALAEFAHGVESLLEAQAGLDKPDSTAIAQLLKAVDTLRKLVAASPEQPLNQAERRQMARMISIAGEFVRSDRPAVPLENPLQQHEGDAPNGDASGPAAPSVTRTLRVGVDKLDGLLDLVGEIAISQGRLSSQIAELPESDNRQALRDTFQHTERLRHDLQERVMKTRLVPVNLLFRSFTRAVRDLAAAADKQIRLEIVGGETEADLSLVEGLREPLTHLVRNAVDHGIEKSGQREKAGKPAAATLRLIARQESSHLVIEIADDGAGISRERVAARAKEQLGIENAIAWSDEQLFALIFESGFSTANQLTDLSGRGLGLNIVRRSVMTLRGALHVVSRPGEGTRFIMRLPLTVAIIDGFRVEAGGEVYILPMESVVECLDMPADPHGGEFDGLVSLRDESLPYIKLAHRFGQGKGGGARARLLVIQSSDGRRAGVQVDAFQGESQIVVKAKEKMFQSVQGVSAFTVLENGRVAMVLDVQWLVADATRAAARKRRR
jgi:two-component system chemotaxis sensor kinase CheA